MACQTLLAQWKTTGKQRIRSVERVGKGNKWYSIRSNFLQQKGSDGGRSWFGCFMLKQERDKVDGER